MYSLRLRAGVCAVVLSIVHAAAAGAAVFTGPFDYSAGTNPVSIALGDIDGDGDPDLVTCQNYNEGLVTILLNDGAGAFREAPGSPLRGIGFPLSAEFGQFNPSVDRNLDLVVVSFVSYNVSTASLFLGDGAGGFRLGDVLTLQDVGFIGRKVAVADYNGDGYDDLAFSDGEVLLGIGDGTFTPAPEVPIGYRAFDVITGDWNGDARPDLAFSVPQFSTVRVFLAGSGGAFTEAAGSPVALSGFTESIVAADFDGDSALDLAVTDFYGQQVWVLLNDGHGSFATATVPVKAGYPRGIAAADFDGDGRADLAVGSNNSPDLSILLMQVGGFTEIDQSPLKLTGGVPVSIVARDLDRDADADLAAVDFQGGNVAVFLNTSKNVVHVPIDVMPGSDQHVIQLGARGVVPVAILGTPTFDATTVDPASVRLAGSPVRQTPSGAFLCQDEDVNLDSIVDLLCHIEIGALQLGPNDTNAVLDAVTFDGTRIEGSDTVRVLAVGPSSRRQAVPEPDSSQRRPRDSARELPVPALRRSATTASL